LDPKEDNLIVFPVSASRYNFRNLVVKQTGRNKNTHLLYVQLPRFVSLYHKQWQWCDFPLSNPWSFTLESSVYFTRHHSTCLYVC